MIITSEIDEDDKEIINRYHGLSRIEDSFRIMKSDLEGRPVFVWTEEHIRAHFLICFIALTIIRLIQYKLLKFQNKSTLNVDGWEQGITADKLKQTLKEFQADKINDEYFKISEINDDRVIGIRDKDCDPVTEHQRMFYYDYSCLEVMMIMNDMTWQSLCYQFYDGELSIDELRSKIFYDLKWLTLFRKLNSEREWGIRFDGFSYSNAWNENECFFDNELGFIELKNINADKQEERLFQCKTDVDGHLAYFDNDDLPFFTQGHDFINYFKCICDGRKGIIIKTIGQVLRGAYRLDDFEKSQLYERLTNYSANTGVRLLRMNQSRTFV